MPLTSLSARGRSVSNAQPQPPLQPWCLCSGARCQVHGYCSNCGSRRINQLHALDDSPAGDRCGLPAGFARAAFDRCELFRVQGAIIRALPGNRAAPPCRGRAMPAETETVDGGDERQRRMLAALAGIGLGNDFVAMLASMGDVRLDADAVRFLTGPVIVHGNAWQDTVPKWLIDQVRGERAEIVFGLAPWPIVGPSEFTAVMMPATMEHPLHSDIVEVYLWASAHAVAKHKGLAPEQIAELLGEHHRLLKDSDVIERSGRYWSDYSALAYEIRRKVIAHAPRASEFKVSLPKEPRRAREETAPPAGLTLALPGTPAPPEPRPDAANGTAPVKLRAVRQPDGRVRYVRVPPEQMELLP